MTSDKTGDNLWRGILCLSLAMRFEKDRARLGLLTALDRVRVALGDNGLWLDGDDELLTNVLIGKVSDEQFAEALCSMKRMGLPGGTVH
jgi:hypothetical protein